jgi:DNA-directed RNA polymerase subunit omega
MARITVEDCVEVVPNRFELCLIASDRARSILSGVETTLNRKEKPAVIALREIAEGLINVEKIKENIINSIKNKGSSDSSENFAEAISDFKEAKEDNADSLQGGSFVDENIQIDD